MIFERILNKYWDIVEDFWLGEDNRVHGGTQRFLDMGTGLCGWGVSLNVEDDLKNENSLEYQPSGEGGAR